jgi:hypothetical protein
MNCRLLPPQSYCKYNPNNEMRWLGRGVETYDLRLSWSTRSRNSTSTQSAFFSQRDYFRITRDQEQSGDHVPQADFPVLIARCPSGLLAVWRQSTNLFWFFQMLNGLTTAEPLYAQTRLDPTA